MSKGEKNCLKIFIIKEVKYVQKSTNVESFTHTQKWQAYYATKLITSYVIYCFIIIIYLLFSSV